MPWCTHLASPVSSPSPTHPPPQTAAGVLQQRIDEATAELSEARPEAVQAKEDGAAAKARAEALESQAAKLRKQWEAQMKQLEEKRKELEMELQKVSCHRASSPLFTHTRTIFHAVTRFLILAAHPSLRPKHAPRRRHVLGRRR